MRSRRFHRLAHVLPVILALLVLLAPSVPADEKATTVEASLEWETGRVGSYKPMYLPLKPDLPKDLVVPEDLHDPRYASILWGDGPALSFALDVAPGHERLFIDLDLDGDLSDEKRTTWSSKGVAASRTETVLVAYPDEPEKIPVQIRLYRSPVWAADRIRITPWVHRRGHAVLGGRLRLVALLDDRSDVRFDDPERANLFVDVDGDGKFNTGTDSYENVGIGKPFRVRDEGWQAEVPFPSGRVVRFIRVDEVPPEAPRTWPRTNPPAAGVKRTPPTESFEELAKRIEEEREKPYNERYLTIRLMGYVGTKEAFDILHVLVRKEVDVNVRSAATRAMGNAAYLEQAAKVVEIATSSWSPPSTAGAAAQALHEMGYEKREDVYLQMLGGNDPTVIGAAARYLAYLRTDRAVRAVMSEWKRAANDNVRYNVYQGLRSLPDGPPVKIIIEAAETTHTTLVTQALRDLLSLGHPKTKSLAMAAAERRPVQEYLGKAIADILSAVGDADAVKALLALAEEGTGGLQLHVAKCLAPVRDPGAIDALVKGLKSRSIAIRGMAALILAGIPEPRVTEALMARSKREKDQTVLTAVLEALGDHGNPKVVDLLLGHAKRRKDVVRLAAIRALARVGLDVPKVRVFFVTLLASRKWQDRVLAIDAAAASGDTKLVRKILPSLDHTYRPVRQAAAEALAVLRSLASIEPLIARLGKEEEARIVDAIAKALFRITGMNLYDDASVWARWWKEKGSTFTLPDTVKDLPPLDSGGTQAGFYGIPVRSGRAIFVIDQSGSMSAQDLQRQTTGAPVEGNRLDVAVREVLNAVKGMKNRDFVNVILFHSTIHPWQDHLRRLTSKNRSALSKHLLSKTPTGGTNLYDGLELALLDPEVDTIFVLSDGMPGSGKYVARDDILRAVKRLNQTKRVAIHAVSIGLDSDLMKQLAEQNGGVYVRR